MAEDTGSSCSKFINNRHYSCMCINNKEKSSPKDGGFITELDVHGVLLHVHFFELNNPHT